MKAVWKEEAIREASEHHICAEYAELMARAKSKHSIIDIYKRGVDWALENQVPSLPLLRREGLGFEDAGLYIDHAFSGDILTDQPVYIFHHCTGEIRVGLNIEKGIIPMLYFANGCDMEVSGLKSLSQIKVPIYIFGENRVRSEASDNIQCRIYHKEVK